MEKSYKEYLKQINTFIFDVDGVLTDGTIQVNTQGEMFRTMNIKDGYGLKTAVEKGFHVCVISGGTNEGVRVRLQNLGIKDIFLARITKQNLRRLLKTIILKEKTSLHGRRSTRF